MEECFSYEARYLLAEDNAGLRGVLPLFLVKNPILGKVLLSSPFAVYGGVLGGDASVRQALYDEALRMGKEEQVDYVEFRNGFAEQCVGVSNINRYVTFSRPVPADEEELLDSLPKKTRNMVRKALKQPFEVAYNVRDPKVFDRVHSTNMRRLGTPNFPIRYFERLLANFGDMADIREVRLGGDVMAVSVNLFFRGSMHTYHAAADSRFNALAPNTFMYFDHLRWAGANGCATFDFGRSKWNTGPFEFKRHWNTVMRELPYEVVLIRKRDLPNVSPANPKFSLPIRIWKKLPLSVTRALSRIVFPLFP